MRKSLINVVVISLGIFLCSWDNQAQEKIVVNVQKRGATVSPSMYGIFFEEINHAGDGGLYAELVQNRSFEDGQLPEGYSLRGNVIVPPPVKNHLTGKVNQIEDRKMRWNPEPVRGWSLQAKDPDAAGIKVTGERPYFGTAPNSLEITVHDASQEVAVVNGGFWGMGIEAGGKYHLRTIVRVSADYKGTVQARLLSENGNVLASCPIETARPEEWNDFRKTLTAKGKDAKAKLAIVFNGTGKVWLDYVSLFPDNTFKGRKNGLRKDIARMIAGLKPSFVRWPGGTIVGGITLDTRMDWKKMLGDPASRPGEIVTWGYRCSYGLGYYEMLQFCEDIGADFMYVCNVGLGDQYRMGNACPEDSVRFYIDDCLNAIEYAIGDKSTVWGARRVADGHSEPFPLKYVEVGNEHWGEEYIRRFAVFHDAIKERYPQLQIIYNAQEFKADTTEQVKTDLTDPHFYETVQGFYRKNNFFDRHPRGKYNIYVGEYACNSGVGSGNMAAALSEAAFIDGMERNGDLVTMTSFAPLLENVNDRRWPVNLIRFNSEKVIGRSSYYVQQMASLNRPAYNVWNSLNEGKSDTLRLQFMASGIDESTGELVLKFVNGSGDTFPTVIQLDGTTEVQKEGKIISLAATSGKEENTPDEPRKIYPQESRFDGFGKTFSYEFIPYSYTVLRIKIM
ncbi:MAG: alpha-L-arabinofuranosidase [Tannerella sp.]|jgi:alpha-L-arabinofuranosidase|nr:alpha-L-arabinofuranosidase [Tannerella sp.]